MRKKMMTVEITEPMIEAGARALFNASLPSGMDWWLDAEPMTKRLYRIKVKAVLEAVLAVQEED
jgi:hypothetical protein